MATDLLAAAHTALNASYHTTWPVNGVMKGWQLAAYMQMARAASAERPQTEGTDGK